MLLLSDEQKTFISTALEGHNILVDACIGSGKTTAIQELCNQLSPEKSILYLTYNRLLKIDAQNRIVAPNAFVTNYHGFASIILNNNGISVGLPDLIQRFNNEHLSLPQIDVLILDEYQDIDQELSEMLSYIKSTNPNMQIIAVGDYEQKIYDKTKLDIRSFIRDFLGIHIELTFTKCFRLSKEHAAMLGRVWEKEIIGTNENCIISYLSVEDVISFLSYADPSNILCLGKRRGQMSYVLNCLEEQYPEKFNKKTVFASIRDVDGDVRTQPNADCAIFTTYDSSKGLERPICVIFDFDENNWLYRKNHSDSKYEILRNIFCVAASRGKSQIIFVKGKSPFISEESLKDSSDTSYVNHVLGIESMFDFKFIEDIEKCYSLLSIEKRQTSFANIAIKRNDEMIDLSPCVGIYQEAIFFKKYDINLDISLQLFFLHNPQKENLAKTIKKDSIARKILFLTSLTTGQDRYMSQVSDNYISAFFKEQIVERLSTHFDGNENVQPICRITINNDENPRDSIAIFGRADVVKNNCVYELKFVSEVAHKNFLQCACYMIALNMDKGVLWNTRDNSEYEIHIPDREKFIACVVNTITKGKLKKYTVINERDNKILYKEDGTMKIKSTDSTRQIHLFSEWNGKKELVACVKKIAVIDTETNFDGELVSIGIIIAKRDDLQRIGYKYYVIDPAYKKPCMYGSALSETINGFIRTISRKEAMEEICTVLKKIGIKNIFAYNASFDMKLLPELSIFQWKDIMSIAAYRQYNNKIPECMECCNTGRLKRNYGVEPIYRMLSGNSTYYEKHNAVYDAMDELRIMQMLDIPVDRY